MVKSKKKFNDIDRSRIVFRVGFHPEFRNLDRFVESINYLIENNFKYIINYVVHPRNYENGSTVYADHIESLERNNFKYELTPYEGEYDGVKYPRKLYDRSEIETALFSAADVHRQKTSVMGSSFMMCEPDGKIYECRGKHVTLGDVYSKSVMLQKVHHVMCFVEKGCYTSRSANTYLSNFFDEKLG
jgi:sulfatase maturation enzyme AslB (radical SAM superfamily)